MGSSKKTESFKNKLTSVFKRQVNNENIEVIKNMNIAIYENEMREIRSKGIVDLFFVLLSIFSGAIIMVFIEGWQFEDSLYWACVTVSICCCCCYCCRYFCYFYVFSSTSNSNLLL